MKLSEKCPECGREFIDHIEYCVEVKLKHHMRNEHGQKVVCEKR